MREASTEEGRVKRSQAAVCFAAALTTMRAATSQQHQQHLCCAFHNNSVVHRTSLNQTAFAHNNISITKTSSLLCSRCCRCRYVQHIVCRCHPFFAVCIPLLSRLTAHAINMCDCFIATLHCT